MSQEVWTKSHDLLSSLDTADPAVIYKEKTIANTVDAITSDIVND